MSETTLSPNEIEATRQRVLGVQQHLRRYFVAKDEIIELMVLCTLAQEPLLLVGKPGTAKSDLIVKFTQALNIPQDRYFEYMLTKFTEPSEILGPVDIEALKQGRYLRRSEGKLPLAQVAFLDEIFKSNSAILNTLLTIINERKFYQDGRPVPVEVRMLFAATNEIPDYSELDALKDRFTLKIQTEAVGDRHFDDLIDRGVHNDLMRSAQQRPWQAIASLDDFERLKKHLDLTMLQGIAADPRAERRRTFPDEVFLLFKRILRTLVTEENLDLSDRKIIKIYRLLRFRAFLHHGGVVTKEDLQVLRHIANRQQDLEALRHKVDLLLDIANT